MVSRFDCSLGDLPKKAGGRGHYIVRSESVAFTQRFLNRSSLDDERILSGHFWGELRVFLAVAKTGSFSRAGKLLSISGPTVSRDVKRLQDMMGAQLLVPGQSGVTLTARGNGLARKLASLDQTLFDLSVDLRAESKDEHGIVRISLTEGLGVFFLVPALRQFSAEHPHIQISVQVPRNLNELRQNQTDMMLAFAETEAIDVTSRRIGTLHLIPVTTRDYIDRYGVPTRANAEEHLFLQSELYQSTSPLWEPWRNLVERGRVAHVSENSFIYGMMVKAGYGIGLLGNYTLMEPAAIPPELGVHIALQMYAAVLTERLAAKPVQLVFNWICEVFGPSNPWFADRLSVTPQPSVADEGFRVMFNLPER